jgi:hypothetical protein
VKASVQRIRHLKNNEINVVKWDNCINNAYNGNIYAFSWYLDILSDQWEAIVHNNYRSVMPLLINKHAGIKYIGTSILANQLGVFSTAISDKSLVNAFIEATKSRYRFFSINLNKYNTIDAGVCRQRSHSNYEFDLIRSYDLIRDAYSAAIRQGIKHAEEKRVSIITGMVPNDFIEFLLQYRVIPSCRLNKNIVSQLRKIIAFVTNHRVGELYAAYTPANTLCAAVLFLKSNRKANVLFSGVSHEGVELRAMELLVDHFIRHHAEKNLTLNFGNLAMPDKVQFFTGFGAQAYHYMNIRNLKNPFLKRCLAF